MQRSRPRKLSGFGEGLRSTSALRFVTVDQNLEFQHDPSQLPVAVVGLAVYRSRIHEIGPLVPEATLAGTPARTSTTIGH